MQPLENEEQAQDASLCRSPCTYTMTDKKEKHTKAGFEDGTERYKEAKVLQRY